MQLLSLSLRCGAQRGRMDPLETPGRFHNRTTTSRYVKLRASARQPFFGYGLEILGEPHRRPRLIQSEQRKIFEQTPLEC